MTRKPPKEHQFKKGQSGNPGGRPRGRTIAAELREVLAEVDPNTRKTLLRKLAEAIVAKALKGDVAAAHFIAERTEGKVKDVLQLEGESRLPHLSDAELVEMILRKGAQTRENPPGPRKKGTAPGRIR